MDGTSSIKTKNFWRKLKMKTIGIINEKGGVSKTTTTINLAYGFAQKGLNVLICDLDHKGTQLIMY